MTCGGPHLPIPLPWRRRCWRGALVIAMLLVGLWAQAAPPVLRVVTDNNYPPYVVLGADGQPEGYVVDLWRLWERKTGIRVEFTAMAWAEAQRAIQDGRADVIDMIFRTPAREQLYDFSEPYATLPVSIYVDPAIQGVTHVQSLRGFTVGVQRGDACVDTLTSAGITTLVAYGNYQEILDAARDGQIRMFCMDDEPASYYLYLNRNQVHFARAFKLYEGQFHWAVNRGDVQSFDAVSQGMRMVTADEREALRAKWFSHPFEFRPYLRILQGAGVVALGIVAVAALWIRTLRNAVRVRTKEVVQKHRQLEATTLQLRKDRAMLRAIIDNSPDAMALKAPDGTYLDANAAELSIANRSREQVVGKTDEEILPDKALAKVARDLDLEVLQTGRPAHYETRINLPNGESRDAEVSKVLVRDQEGAPAGVLVVARDVTERRRTERELRLAAAAFDSHDALMITNANGTIERVNRAFSRVTGFPSAEAIGQTPRLLQSGAHPPEFYASMWARLASDGHWQGEVVNRHRDGRLYSARLGISRVVDEDGRVLHYLGDLQDVTAEKEARELALRLKLFDPLTELPNRWLLEDRMRQALGRSDEQRQFGAVMMIDLDRFQNINDTLGHGTGDLLLQGLAQRMRDALRDSDTLARFSGDSFVLLAQGLGDTPGEAGARAQALADALRQSAEAPIDAGQHCLSCTVSIGIALFCGQEPTPETLLRQAELAMYQSKSDGRNQVRFFEEAMQTEVNRRSALEQELREALLTGQLALHYQLQVDGDGRAIGAEALIRWNHPLRGQVSPADFIPLAEDTGLIEPIGHWALAEACRQLARWSQVAALQHLSIAVNVSPRQFRSPNFVADVQAQVQAVGITAHRLKLEVTESVAIDDVDDSVAKLQALKDVGFHVSLDDFGTGNSSLNVLTKLPLTQLKIDKSFVDNLPQSQRDAMVAQTIVNMGRGLELHVIAEGVETQAQFRCLKDLGCAAFQGYYFGRPMSAAAFEAALSVTAATAVYA